MNNLLSILNKYEPRRTDLSPICSSKFPLPIDIFIKEEGLQRSGSSKGRAAFRVLHEAILKGFITSRTIIVESSSGNMAIALAYYAVRLNLRVHCITDNRITLANRRILEGYGNCQIVEVPMDNNKNRVPAVRAFLKDNRSAYWPRQYTNRSLPGAYHSIIDELKEQCPNLDYLFVPVSTGGTARGLITRAKRRMPRLKIVLVDAIGSSTLGLSKAGERSVPGFGSSLPSSFVKPSKASRCVLVTDKQAIEGARLLLQRGFLCGGSTGAVFAAVLSLREAELPAGSKVAIFSPDCGDRYLDTIFAGHTS